MKFRYFGTAAAEGWPAVFCECDNCKRAAASGGRNIRTRSQALVGGALLIDLPADTYYHKLVHGLDLCAVTDVIITHDHGDHFYPAEIEMRLPPFALSAGGGNLHMMTFWANERATETLNALYGNTRLDWRVNRFVEVHAFEPFDAGGYRVTPLPANHDMSQHSLIYIIEGEGKRILYAHDTGYLMPEAWKYLAARKAAGDRPFDFVSLDCTDIMHDPKLRNGHMGFDTAAEVRDQLISEGLADKNAVFCLNHFSHNGVATYDELLPLATARGLLVSYDGMELDI